MTTTDLVPVFSGTLAGQDTPLCNARDLHAALEVGDRFDQWIRRRIEQYGFVDGEDFCTVLCKTRGRAATDYHLTLDTAKELSMVENNDIGRRIRRYLISLEKKQAARSLPAPPPAPAPTFLNRRWLITFDHEGRERVTPIDPEDFITNLREFPEMLRDPGFMAIGDQLAEIIRACTDRMASKIRGRPNNAKPGM